VKLLHESILTEVSHTRHPLDI